MGSEKYYEELVRRFVDFLNAQNLESIGPEELPVDMRGPASQTMPDWFTWKISQGKQNPWIEQLEQRMPRSYPKPFHILISKYRFSYFEAGPIMFFANTGEAVFYELASRVFADRHMSPFLLQNGYLQFGQAARGKL